MNRDFFVGYSTIPVGTKNFLRLAVAAMLVIGLGVGGWIASSQQSAGEGRWDPAMQVSTSGLLSLDPYPILHRADGSSVLLVKPGKTSATSLVAEYAGKIIAVRGVPIERGGWSMLEVYRAGDVQAAPSDNEVLAPPRQSQGEVTLNGEIVDSKCFFGVMKPGAGKVHRACAAMCLTGGMPPMLVVTGADGLRYGYMLVTQDGSSASLQVVPDVAVPVRITGALEVRGDLTYLRLQERGVERLNAVVSALSIL